MTDDPRVEELLEELLDSGGAPEDVCCDCPELLPQVRAGWRRLRALEAEVSALFPESTSPGGSSPPAVPAIDLPRIRGYDVRRVLGRGGMGVVYKAWHLRLNRPVAVKMLLAGAYARPEELERFLREAEAVAGLRHANIVQVYDVGDLDGRPFFTMEFVEGGSLAQKLAGTPQPVSQAAALVAAAAEAVQVAHQSGIVHRDLKPANILLTADGMPKITDFGLARRLEDGSGLTQSGAAVGTPSYMAPEQARGQKDAIGPAADVYALGAILYEMLTGRPPFQAETATATLQLVLSEDPVPPARLNPRVPRDLETICLKCLHKERQRRYASAAALADDLRRFGRGEPIAARRMGPMERGVRWLRRHPALGAALAVSVLLALALTGVGVRWQAQRSAALQAAVTDVEKELREAERLREKSDFVNASAALDRAKLRLNDQGPDELHNRLARESRNLALVKRLDDIRLNRVLVRPQFPLARALLKPVTDHPDDGATMKNRTPPSRMYHQAFREEGFGIVQEDPADVAARVRDSPVRAVLVAALDDWAACALDRDQQAWVLAVARLADDDAWRNRLRDPKTWSNRQALADLAAKAPIDDQLPQVLVVLGARLRSCNGNAKDFLTRVVLAHPHDFWANVELGNALVGTSPLEAIGYFRTALAIRPKVAPIHVGLGYLFQRLNRFEEAANHFGHAARLDPWDAYVQNCFGVVSHQAGRLDQAIAQFRVALRLDASQPCHHCNLGIALRIKGRLGEAMAEFLEALRLDPNYGQANQELQGILREGRGDELRRAWKKHLAAHPPRHDAWFGYAELCLFLGEEAEYRGARRDLLARFGNSTEPAVAERTGRACLLMPVSGDELRQAVALTERAVAAGRSGREWAYPYYRFARGLAAYRQNRLDDAIAQMKGGAATVMGPCPRLITALAQHQKGKKDQALKTLAAAVLSYDWSAAKADSRDPWIAHVLRREAEAMILPNLPAFLEGKYQPHDKDECLALLGVCQFKDLRGAMAGLYAAAFAADPKLAEDLQAGCRYRAACAAALAGCGGGADGAGLGEEVRAHWRKQARAWLRADLDAWAKKLQSGPAAERGKIQQTLARWRAAADLAGLRDADALDRLSPAERQECRALWSDLDARLGRARPPE